MRIRLLLLYVSSKYIIWSSQSAQHNLLITTGLFSTICQGLTAQDVSCIAQTPWSHIPRKRDLDILIQKLHWWQGGRPYSHPPRSGRTQLQRGPLEILTTEASRYPVKKTRQANHATCSQSLVSWNLALSRLSTVAGSPSATQSHTWLVPRPYALSRGVPPRPYL